MVNSTYLTSHPKWDGIAEDLGPEPIRFVEPLDATATLIELFRHNPIWASAFDTCSRQLRRLPGVLTVSHIGSTGIVGLPAKAVLDIDMVIDFQVKSVVLEELQTLGFQVFLFEPMWHEHYVLKHQSPQTNLHIFPEGCCIPARDLAFKKSFSNQKF